MKKLIGRETEPSSFLFQGNDVLPGTQIDLLIDRNDHDYYFWGDGKQVQSGDNRQ